MTTRHVKAIVFNSTKSEIGAALRKLDEADRLAQGIENHDAIEVL